MLSWEGMTYFRNELTNLVGYWRKLDEMQGKAMRWRKGEIYERQLKSKLFSSITAGVSFEVKPFVTRLIETKITITRRYDDGKEKD